VITNNVNGAEYEGMFYHWTTKRTETVLKQNHDLHIF